jgi:UDP-glucose 4-epimerase
MKIIVTGACGMIGSSLCEKLINDPFNNVTAIDDLSFGNIENIKHLFDYSNFEFVKHDLKKKIKLNDQYDLIYHLAAYKKTPPTISKYRNKNSDKVLSVTSGYDVMINNSKMAQNIIYFAQKKDIPIIFTSTSDVYHNHKDFLEDSPVTFGPPYIERFSYALSKWFEEQLYFNMYHEKKIRVSIARIFGCFSEKSKNGWSAGHMPIFINQALRNQDIVIHGDGLQTRSLSHVSDIVDGLVQMGIKFDKVNGQILNLGSSEEITILECAKKIIKACKSKSKIVHITEEDAHGKGYNDIRRRFADTGKAKRLIGYKTKINFEEGLNIVLNKIMSDERFQ